MSDFLLELSKNPQARKLIQSMGLPIPMPQDLKRAKGPIEIRILAKQNVAIYSTAGSKVTETLAQTLAEAGANPYVVGGASVIKHFKTPGIAFGQPAEELKLDQDIPEGLKFNALILDGTEFESIADLRKVYDFFHPLVSRVGACGRMLVLARPVGAQKTLEAASAQAALRGFARSLGKELGKKGTTAQLLSIEEGAEDRLPGTLRFFLSCRSTYITCQPVEISSLAKAVQQDPVTSPLAGKVVVVTGAARGIGAATVRILAAEGAKVICLDRPEDDGPTSQLAREVNGAVFLTDVTDKEAPKKIAEYLKKEHGGVDVVIHNAGITRDKTIANMKPENWDMTIDVNLGAVARITSALLEGVLRDEGRIICLSSIAGLAGNMGQTNYAASKSGIIGLVQHLSAVVKDRGITVNAIAPGFIETRLTDAIPIAIREVGRRLNSLGQGGQPVDVGQALTFLATPASQGVTGQVIRVCGGALLGA
ncbi:3-oxoacyl-ACP reductase [Deltaproteobacteria bacterium TL4]